MAAAILVATALAARAAEPRDVDMEGPYTGGDSVYVIPINDAYIELGGMVDPWLAAFVKRKIAEAKALGPKAIILEIDTYGGAVFASELIAQALDTAEPVPTVAYVKTKASSAGAHISLSCNRIYMKDGARIGSAMGIMMTKDGVAKLDPKVHEKMTSDLRAAFRARAEKNGHSKALAEAMVDTDIEVVQVRVDEKLSCIDRREFDRMIGDTPLGKDPPELVKVVVEKGKLLNLTAREAQEYGLSAGTVSGMDDLLAQLGCPGARIFSAKAQTLERTARVLQGPLVAGIIMSIGSLAILFAFYTSSATAAFVAIFCFGFFFWAKMMGGTASSWEIALFLIGFISLAVEVFAIPGFGFFGIAGIVMIFSSLVLSMLPPGIFGFGGAPDLAAPMRWGYMMESAGAVMGAFLLATLVMAVAARYLHVVPVFGRIVMQKEIVAKRYEGAGAGGVAAPSAADAAADEAGVSVGDEGTAKTDMAPGGKAVFGEKTLMVIADGEFIEAGAEVKVTEIKGRTIVVVRA